MSEPRSRLERTFDPEVVQTMKARADRDLSFGGVGPAAEASRASLVDRYVLRLVPAIVGGGTRALPDSARVDLALNSTRHFDDGSVLVDYSRR